MSEAVRRIGLLYGMEQTFPAALARAIDDRGGGDVTGEPVEVSALRDTQSFEYALILDRISHEVPFYRTFLKVAAARGVAVVNNPFWWSADDKYFGNIVAAQVGVETPRTMLLPHKHRPPNTEASSFRNLKFVDWQSVFDYLGFPIYLKPAYGGGWRNVYRAEGPGEFFAAYDQTRDLTMMAQEAIEYDDYYRVFTVGRDRVRVMRFDPRRSPGERYLTDGPPIDATLESRLRRDALALSSALGYDMNTVELAMRGGTPYAIDFTNPASDAELKTLGEANFAWLVENVADVLIEHVRNPRPFEFTGSWSRGLALRDGIES